MIWTPFDQSLKTDPYPHYASQMKLASVFMAPSQILFALDYESVKHILKRHVEFRSTFPDRNNSSFPALERLMDHCLLVNEGKKHSANRRQMSESYHLQGVDSHIEELSARLIHKLQSKPIFDLVNDLILPVTATTIQHITGLTEVPQERIKNWSGQLLRSVDILVDSQSFLRMDQASTELEDHIKRLVEGGQASGFLRHLSEKLCAVMPRHAATQKVVSMTGTLLFTGINTTVGLIGNVMMQLLANPKLWEELKEMYSERGAIPDVGLEELIRLNHPIHFTFRFAQKQCSIQGIELQEDQLIALCIASANRDATVFKQPNGLIWDRKPNPHMSFGLGKHYCFGAGLAKAQLRIVLSSLINLMPGLSLQSQRASYMRYNFVRAPKSIIVENTRS